MAFEKRKIIVLAGLAAAFLFYSFYLYLLLPIKKYGITAEIIKGKSTWQQYNCNSCHQVYGLGGYLGPDVTNVYSNKGPAYIQAFLKKGTAIMPDFHLTEQEITDLTAYLKNISSTGNSDPKSFTLKHDGTIEQ